MHRERRSTSLDSPLPKPTAVTLMLAVHCSQRQSHNCPVPTRLPCTPPIDATATSEPPPLISFKVETISSHRSLSRTSSTLSQTSPPPKAPQANSRCCSTCSARQYPAKPNT